jgi:hypothetical protein
MERILSYKKIDDYFRNLAQKNIDIRDYCGTSVSELADKIASVQGTESPILVFFDYSSKLEGNEQRTFSIRSLAFSILFKDIKPDQFQSQTDAIDQAEAIGLEVLSRIYIQSKMPDIGWLYKNFQKESVVMMEVKSEGQDGFYGMEFHFDLKTLEPLVVDKSKWSDGDIFCGN